MTIPASRVKNFIDPRTFQTIELRDVNGSLIGPIDIDGVRELTDADAVVGKCGRSRLKYLKLIDPSAQAGAERGRTPMEILGRMVSDRKFTYRERLTKPCSITGAEEWSGLSVIRHKDSAA